MTELIVFLGLVIGGSIAFGCFLAWALDRKLDKDE